MHRIDRICLKALVTLLTTPTVSLLVRFNAWVLDVTLTDHVREAALWAGLFLAFIVALALAATEPV